MSWPFAGWQGNATKPPRFGLPDAYPLTPGFPLRLAGLATPSVPTLPRTAKPGLKTEGRARGGEAGEGGTSGRVKRKKVGVLPFSNSGNAPAPNWLVSFWRLVQKPSNAGLPLRYFQQNWGALSMNGVLVVSSKTCKGLCSPAASLPENMWREKTKKFETKTKQLAFTREIDSTKRYRNSDFDTP